MAPAFEILYLAENPMVALFEARALFGSPTTPGGVVPHPNRPLVTLPILVSLGAIADSRLARCRSALPHGKYVAVYQSALGLT